MPMNDMRHRGQPPSRPGPSMCENPDCDRPAVKGKRYCSFCMAVIDANGGTLPKSTEPKAEPPKTDG